MSDRVHPLEVQVERYHSAVAQIVNITIQLYTLRKTNNNTGSGTSLNHRYQA